MWRDLAHLLASTHLFAVVLAPPEGAGPALRRLARVRLRLAELVAGPAHTLTAALLKHPYEPVGRTARVVLDEGASA